MLGGQKRCCREAVSVVKTAPKLQPEGGQSSLEASKTRASIAPPGQEEPSNPKSLGHSGDRASGTEKQLKGCEQTRAATERTGRWAGKILSNRNGTLFTKGKESRITNSTDAIIIHFGMPSCFLRSKLHFKLPTKHYKKQFNFQTKLTIQSET